MAAGVVGVRLNVAPDPFTVTVAEPSPVLYVVFPPYDTLIVSVPVPREFAGMVNEYPPVFESVAVEVYEPAVSVTVPVGAAPPAGELATVPVTPSARVTLRLLCAGVTDTVTAVPPETAAQPFTTLATFSDPKPVAIS
jgi:hypothetical protein